MASGEATIRSCPIIIAAWPTLLVGGGTLASAAGSPSASLRPSPKSAAASVSAFGFSSPASETKAVLHDCAKSRRNGTAPAASPSKLRNGLPSTVSVRGQSTVRSTSRPARSSAVVETTLNVEPGA